MLPKASYHTSKLVCIWARSYFVVGMQLACVHCGVLQLAAYFTAHLRAIIALPRGLSGRLKMAEVKTRKKVKRGNIERLKKMPA